jgi:hypothetical protein
VWRIYYDPDHHGVEKNKQFMRMKNDALENCEVESQTVAFKFVKALSAMEGTYTKQCGTQYTT